MCIYINTGALLYRDTVNDKQERLYENLFGESENSVCQWFGFKLGGLLLFFFFYFVWCAYIIITIHRNGVWSLCPVIVMVCNYNIMYPFNYRQSSHEKL